LAVAKVLKLRGSKVTLRRARASDAKRLLEIFSEREVASRWGTYTAKKVRRELIKTDEGAVGLVIRYEGRTVGYLDFYEERDPEYRHAGLDIALDPAYHGRGLASDAIRAVARFLFDTRGHHRLVIDPAADNEKAIRAYTAAGFRPVGVMRQYERIDRGAWHDGLLMDLLKDELR
jgi:aminoglycoside 6'-N-acetyltransferase